VDRRYRLPAAHAEVLLDADHAAHAGATAWWMGSLAQVLQRIPDLYRSGQGLPYPEYGADCRLAIANFNRPMFVNDLAGWFAAARARRPPAGRGSPGAGRRLRRRLVQHLAGPGLPVAAGGRGPGRGRREGGRDLHRPGDEIERLNFAFSWWHCLPASRAETPSAAAGTALRPGTVRDRAGFASLRELPVDHLFWRFYELR
jgi:hypothetical protein